METPSESNTRHRRYPIVHIGIDGPEGIVTKDEVFYNTFRNFLEDCADYDRNPLGLLPEVTEFRPATISADDIRGHVQEALPDDDHGGDPIHEASVCEEAAAAANAVLAAANLGAYWGTKRTPYLPDAWREMYVRHDRRPGAHHATEVPNDG